MQEYADPVIDWLDGGRGLFGKKLYRDVRPDFEVFASHGC
jgi:hypothetical protein